MEYFNVIDKLQEVLHEKLQLEEMIIPFLYFYWSDPHISIGGFFLLWKQAVEQAGNGKK